MLAGWNPDGTLAALAPLYQGSIRLWPGFVLPSLGWIGDEGVGSEYLGILARPGQGEDFLEALERYLRGAWSLMDLRGLKEDGSLSRMITGIFSSRAPGRIHRVRHPCSAISLPGDYEAYLGTLPQKFRSTVRYRTNKLTKNFQVRLIRTTHVGEIPDHLEIFFAMHQRRWTADGKPGSFYSPRKRAFYQEVAEDFLKRGWLRFYHLEVDGLIRASQFGFIFGGVLHSLQEAFDHTYNPPGVGGVGVVLRGMAIRECISEGIHNYDFLGGIEEYKARWNTSTHYVQHVRIGAPGFCGAVAYASTAGALTVRNRIRERAPGWLLRMRRHIRSWAETQQI